MIHEELELVEISRSYSFEELNSEQILKIFDKPYLTSEVARAFDIDEKTVIEIRRKRGIKNILLESMIRDIIIILYYIKENYSYVTSNKIQNIIDYIIFNFTKSVPKRQFYIDKLKSIDWLKLNIIEEIKIKQIDIEYRMSRNIRELKYIDDIFKKSNLSLENNNYYNDKYCYKNLLEEKNRGKVFTKDELTYDILYKLSIEESVADSLIGNIFNLTKQQVRGMRIKNGLQNAYLKGIIDFPEKLINYIKEKGLDIDLSNEHSSKLYYESLKAYTKMRGWNIDTFEKYWSQKKDKNVIPIEFLEVEYDVVISKKEHRSSKINTHSKSNGRKSNQSQTNKNKITSGILGEKIVYDYERERLKKLGFDELSNQVRWISQTEQEEITFDGLGYDIISYNEQGEKIYIEVKCSSTSFSDNVIFNVSSKEISLMNSEIDGIDKKYCFIYYVSKIDSNLLMAEIFIIDSEMFSTYNLKPVNYQVSEFYNNL